MLPENVPIVVDVIRDGGIVLFPTETVYGIGTAMGNLKGVEQIYKVKKRNREKPLTLHVGSYATIYDVAEVNDRASDFMERFLPGPYTLILPSKDKSIASTIGIRFPALSFLMDVLRRVGKGMWGTSANISGGISPCSFDEVQKEILNDVDIAVDGGTTYYRSASTVVDLTGGTIRILREGAGIVSWL